MSKKTILNEEKEVATKRERDKYYRLRNRVIKLKEKFEAGETQPRLQSRYRDVSTPSNFPYRIKRGLRDFKNYDEFLKYMKRLEDIVKHGYDKPRVDRYIENLKESLYSIYGKDEYIDIIIKKLDKVDRKEILKYLGDINISYFYYDRSMSDDDKLNDLENRLNNALGNSRF